MEKKKDIIDLIIGFMGAMIGCLGVNIFNRYVLMSLPLAARMICMPIVYWLIALIPIILIICRKTKIWELGFKKENISAQIIVGIAIAIVMSVVLTLIPHIANFSEWVDNGRRYVYLWQFIYEFGYCIIGIGLAEEFVFRGFLYTKAKNIFNSEWSAGVISSVMFGLFHIFTGNIIQVFVTTLIGLLYCFLRSKIKNCSLLSLIIAHGIYDALITTWASLLLKS